MPQRRAALARVEWRHNMSMNPNRRPLRPVVGKLAGTGDWYLVWNEKRTRQIAVRRDDLNHRVPAGGPYETKSQALCERTDR